MPTALNNEDACRVLGSIPELGPIMKRKLLDAFGNAKNVFSAEPAHLKQIIKNPKVLSNLANWQRYCNLEKQCADEARYGINFVPYISKDYPTLLKEIYDYPLGLYIKGNLKIKQKVIGIVGRREASSYGKAVAKHIGCELAKLGFCIVSGLARGIDTHAHLGALEANGQTVAVLGNGLDITYPPENKKIQNRIADTGALISELNLGAPTNKMNFPIRNRIISGLCEALIVVESAMKGGSMITARLTTEQNRSLFAVPGRIDAKESEGCNDLIRQGACIFTKVDDLLEELSYNTTYPLPINIEENKPSQEEALTDTESLLLKVFKAQPKQNLNTDELIDLTQLEARIVASTLLMLEVKQKILRLKDGSFELTPILKNL